jgi:RNA polymerase I-specific transcription initiation factor RRN3
MDNLLEESIKRCFPFHRANTKAYMAYVKNILTMCTYFPDLQVRTVRLIIDKIVVIDGAIGTHIDDLDDEELEFLENQLRDDMAELLASDQPEAEKKKRVDENGEEIASDDEDENDATQSMMKSLKSMKEDMLKLDVVIGLLFEHYHKVLSKEVAQKQIVNGKSSLLTSYAFETLLYAFQDTVLTTWSSRHSQYLLFRFSQLQPEFYECFTDSLLKLAFDKHGAIPIRMAAVSYLASFVARAAKVGNEDVLNLFARFSKELEKLRKKYENISKGPDPEQFRFYYTLFQGCMYIFCFRWRSFLINPDDDESVERIWHAGVKDLFNLNMHSKLNPLKVCSPLIVDMFAKVTKSLDFLYIYSKLETNKRVRLTRVLQFNTMARETALTMKTSESSLKLEAQYAFEPYALPISKQWIKGLYVTFDTVAPPGMLDDEDSSDEDEDDDEEEEEEIKSELKGEMHI